MQNYGQARVKTLKLLDEYTTGGTEQTTEDVRIKIRDFTNDAMVDLASSTAKINGDFYVTHAPVYNELSRDNSSIVIHDPLVGDTTIELVGARSYWFEATGPATVVVEEYVGGAWVDLPTPLSITIPATVTSMTEYKGLITAASLLNNVRLRFTGSYVYRFRNHILYPYTWPDAASVQQNRSNFDFDLPADFLKLNNIMVKKNTRLYVPCLTFILVPNHKISVNRFEGPCEYLVHYWRMPTLFTFTGVEATDDAQTFGIDATAGTYRVSDDAAMIIPYYVAGCIKNSEGDLINGLTLINLFEAKKSGLTGNDTNYQSQIINATGW